MRERNLERRQLVAAACEKLIRLMDVICSLNPDPEAYGGWDQWFLVRLEEAREDYESLCERTWDVPDLQRHWNKMRAAVLAEAEKIKTRFGNQAYLETVLAFSAVCTTMSRCRPGDPPFEPQRCEFCGEDVVLNSDHLAEECFDALLEVQDDEDDELGDDGALDDEYDESTRQGAMPQ
jgi:hypothetical protein